MKKFFTKKKVIGGAVVLLIIGFFAFRGNGNTAANIQSENVRRQDLKQTVLATGQVTSQTDLSLSFKSSGIVSRVSIKVGDKAKTGQILANLDQRDQAARLTQARGSLAQARANLQKVLDGASSQEVAVAQVALDSAKSVLETTKTQQEVLVNNAYKALLNSTLEARESSGNIGSVTVNVSGYYTGKEQGQYKITLYASQIGGRFQYSGIESGNGIISTSPQPLGTKGLFITFSGTTDINFNNSWIVEVPNTSAANYVTNYNAYQAALETQKSQVSAAENSVASAQANLDLKKAQARPADVAAAQAQVTSALGQVQLAEADLENTIIRAPADGTITKVDAKVGQQAMASTPLIVLQDVGNLHVEANVSEANIALLKPSQEVELTFDALGLDRKFTGKVQAVDPASTVVSGVVNYKVTIALDKIEEIKPGMTANLTVKTAEKPGVIAIPQRAILNKDGKKKVRVVTDSKTKAYTEIEVSTGLEGDGGLVEVTSGLNENQEIVTFIKTN